MSNEEKDIKLRLIHNSIKEHNENLNQDLEQIKKELNHIADSIEKSLINKDSKLLRKSNI